MQNLACISIHRRKVVAHCLAVALFEVHQQHHQFIVNGQNELRIGARLILEKIRVLNHGKVRVTLNAERLGELPVSLLLGALLIAVQLVNGVVLHHLLDLIQRYRVKAVPSDHAVDGGLKLLRIVHLVALQLLALQLALAEHLHHLLAPTFRTAAAAGRGGALVAGKGTQMITAQSSFGALLSAHRTVALVADLYAVMHAAGKGLLAEPPTGDPGLVAGHRGDGLVTAVALSADKLSAGRTLWVVVALVSGRVGALVHTGAGLSAGRSFGAAGQWRVEDLLAAVAVHLSPDDIRAGLAEGVAGLVASVTAAVELSATNLATGVLLVSAALIKTFVSPTAQLLVTATLALEAT